MTATGRERLKGVLIGCALGDAMAMPTEMWTREHIQAKFPEGISEFLPSQPEDFFKRHMKVGAVTDDTLNTVMLLETIAANEGVPDTWTYLEALRAWHRDSALAAWVTGPSTTRALEALSRGVPLEETGKFGTTNGAAMKIAPVAMVTPYKNMTLMAERVEALCMPTHNTSVAIAGACVIAACVGYALSGEARIEGLYATALKAIEAAGGRGHALPSADMGFRIQQAMAIAESGVGSRSAEQRALDRLYAEIGTTMETIDTVPAALAIVTLAEGEPLRAARLSAQLGGDTDTIGAISGAICGALKPQISDAYVHTLETVNALHFEDLVDKIAPFSPYVKEKEVAKGTQF